ncbi:MAG: acylase [Thermoanaerobaculia bacterium]
MIPKVRNIPRVALVAVLAVFLTATACKPPAPQATEILWDEWGVPHIYAPDLEQLTYAQGWAHARNHGDLVLRLIGQARGRAAEYWGEAHLESDRWVRTVGIPGRGEAWYQAQGPGYKEALDAFARGINDYVTRHADAIADDVEVVLPVSAADVLAHLQRVIHFTFLVDPREVAAATRQLGAGEKVAQGPVSGSDAKGSNAWAVAPKRSASGHAMLVANPHLPWSDLFTWFEVHLVSPEVDITGVTLVGTPVVGIGFNDHLGWTHTVNTHDGVDFYELTLGDGGYVFDGEVRAFEVTTETLEVLGDDGVREEELEIRRSIHGPVVAEANGKALALRTVGLDHPAMFEQYWEMARATDFETFETALRRLQMPMFTTMYADRDGHILHLFGGLTPKRPAGDWDWSGVVPGDTSATLWTETHPYDDLPRVVDPDSGWLQNANDPPWTTTFPAALDADDFPSYMAPRFMHFRAQQSAELLMADDSITFEELETYKHSTEMELAVRLLDDLEAAVAAHGDETAKRAMEVLVAWDRTSDSDSRGGVLFAAFFRQLRGVGANPFAIPWSEDDPLTTPDGLADPAAAASALAAAAENVETTYGAVDVSWGEVHRLRRGDRDLAGNGGPSELGVFRVVAYRPGEDGKASAVHGDSYVAVIEFSDPLRAEELLSYGNATQPGSPHFGDQLELFARKELRPVWRTRADVEAHLEERETF